MNQPVYALVDCNNFFVSCERVFQPRLRGRAVAVLSNNDGCIVARSNEVKKLGIPMGAPLFKYKEIIRKNKVITLSSNFTLYQDMSRRVMEVLKGFVNKMQVYSIDEAFLQLDSLSSHMYEDLGRDIKDKVYKCTGIPVSVGIANNKTLAKIAGERSKKNPEFDGVLSLIGKDQDQVDLILEKIPIGDVWGVGFRSVGKFEAMGIETAKDFKYFDTRSITRLRGIVGYRMQQEIRGIPCFALHTLPEARKSIACTRSFGKKISEINELREAITSYVSTACEKLRRQRSVATTIYVFIHTNWHQQYEKYYSNGISISLNNASFDTRDFVKAALEGLDKIYVPGLAYKKAGIFLSGIMPYSSVQMNLFLHNENRWRRELRVLKQIDKLNQKWGHGTLRIGSEGFNKKWFMKREKLSPRFTTRWEEIPRVR